MGFISITTGPTGVMTAVRNDRILATALPLGCRRSGYRVFDGGGEPRRSLVSPERVRLILRSVADRYEDELHRIPVRPNPRDFVRGADPWEHPQARAMADNEARRELDRADLPDYLPPAIREPECSPVVIEPKRQAAYIPPGPYETLRRLVIALDECALPSAMQRPEWARVHLTMSLARSVLAAERKPPPHD